MPDSIQGKGSQKRFAKPLAEGKTYIATSPKLADCDPYFIFELPKRYFEHTFAALFSTKEVTRLKPDKFFSETSGIVGGPGDLSVRT